jgi:hypothetical protein
VGAVKLGKIHQEFFAGRMSAEEAARRTMALRGRPSRGAVIGALVVGLPMLIAVAAWALVFLGKGAP